MKLVSFLFNNKERAGIFREGKVFDISESAKELNLNLPGEMGEILKGEEEAFRLLRKIENAAAENKLKEVNSERLRFIAPVPHPTSCRDGYAFRQHVATARRNRGVEMIPEFDQYPVFYFTNHNAIFGEGEITIEDDHLKGLDFELEASIVIGKKGRNITSDKADDFIAGYMVMNDLSARVLQMEEMKLNLGPAKGKDFATAIGPYLVTPDELEPYLLKTEFGNKYSLRMKAYHNGKQISEGNMNDMNWTFAELIERISYGADIFPGDVIGSGTVGTGCYLELNGTWALEAKQRGETHSPIWLKDGDIIECEIEGLGKLTNKIVKSPNSHSILSKKKM